MSGLTDLVDMAIEAAIAVAQKSPCAKSKRGVVIFGPDTEFVAEGFNGPPRGFACDGSDACHAACGKVCVHAEQRALVEAESLPELTDLVHVKVVNGKAVPSGPPSCWQCSRAILGSDVQRVWLLHDDGLRCYSPDEFHEQTLLHCGLPVIRATKET